MFFLRMYGCATVAERVETPRINGVFMHWKVIVENSKKMAQSWFKNIYLIYWKVLFLCCGIIMVVDCAGQVAFLGVLYVRSNSCMPISMPLRRILLRSVNGSSAADVPGLYSLFPLLHDWFRMGWCSRSLPWSTSCCTRTETPGGGNCGRGPTRHGTAAMPVP